jgi:hypothetical protein
MRQVPNTEGGLVCRRHDDGGGRAHLERRVAEGHRAVAVLIAVN